jgi:hypothetical protein
MTEMALYTVEGDRIIREEFYYAPQPGFRVPLPSASLRARVDTPL